MDAPRTVTAEKFRITILPGKRIRLYTNPSLRDVPGLLESGPYLANLSFEVVRSADGWLVSKRYGGLPMRKVPGLRSIEEAWDYELVDIERRMQGRYVPIDDLGAV